MLVSCCTHESLKKFGKNATGKRRLRCKLCGHTWLEDAPKPIGGLRISLRDAQTVLGLLLEGMSLRAASRLTGLDRNTIGDLILAVGDNCQALLDSVRRVAARDVEADEIWSFVGLKENGQLAAAAEKKSSPSRGSTASTHSPRNPRRGQLSSLPPRRSAIMAWRAGGRRPPLGGPFFGRGGGQNSNPRRRSRLRQ